MKLFRKYIERKRQERADQEYADDYLDVQEERRRAEKKRGRATKGVGLGVFLLLVLTGCKSVFVYERFPDGSPKKIVETVEGERTVDPTNEVDKVCILMNGCPFWESPKIRYWEQRRTKEFVDWYWIVPGLVHGGGHWVVTYYSPWVNYLTCEKELPNTDNRCKEVAIAGTRG